MTSISEPEPRPRRALRRVAIALYALSCAVGFLGVINTIHWMTGAPLWLSPLHALAVLGVAAISFIASEVVRREARSAQQELGYRAFAVPVAILALGFLLGVLGAIYTVPWMTIAALPVFILAMTIFGVRAKPAPKPPSTPRVPI